MSDHRNTSSGAQPESAWNGTKIVRITATDGANLWAERSQDSDVIRHYGEGHSLPVNSFAVTRKNGEGWYQVEAYNGHGIGYVRASLVEPESFGDSSLAPDDVM